MEPKELEYVDVELGLDLGTLARLAKLSKGVSPEVIGDVIQLAEDVKILMETPEGQKVLEDLLKLASDFKSSR